MAGHPDKEKIARSFLRGKLTYDQHAGVQKKVARRLVDMLAGYPSISYDRVLEIGCCTGGMTEMFLDRHTAGTLYLNDLVHDFYKTVQERFAQRTGNVLTPLFGDIEEIAIPGDLDLVLSSSTFQWLVDLEGFFAKIAKALTGGGFLAFSLFGPGTLAEFRELTGIGLSYRSLDYILEILEKDYFLRFSETESHRIFFPSPREVLRHLQATGVGGVSDFRWSSRKLRVFEDQYTGRFGSPAGIPVTYVTSYVMASKK
jgi:malonyl-CoA O-methyltransferase